MSPSRAAGRRRIPWLRRRWWIPVVTTVGVVALVTALGQTAAPRYRAHLVLVVATGNNRSPSEAQKLAATYARLIPQDAKVLAAIADPLRLTPKTVQHRLEATTVPSTQLLDITYQGSSRAEAQAAAQGLIAAVSGETPISPAISPASLVVVRPASDIKRNAGPGATDLPVAAVLGLLLGVGLGFLLERIDARIDDAGEAERQLDCPVTPVAGATPRYLAAMVARWPHAAGGPTRVAVLPVAADATTGADRMAALLHQMFSGPGTLVPPAGAVSLPTAYRDEAQSNLRLSVGGVPGGREAGELVAIESDVVVLVVSEGGRVRDLRAAVDVLAEFNVTADWCIFARGDIARRSLSRSEAVRAGSAAPAAADAGAASSGG